LKVDYVRIQNFRSIIDSGNFYLDNNMTVLAGKNESGKSTILKALETFSSGEFSEEDFCETFYHGGFEYLREMPEISVFIKFTYKEVCENFLYEEQLSEIPFVEPFDLQITKRLERSGKLDIQAEGTLINFVFRNRFNQIYDDFNNFLFNLNLVEDYLSYDLKGIEEYNDKNFFTNSNDLKHLFNRIHNINLHVEYTMNNESLKNSVVKDLDSFLNISRSIEGYIEDTIQAIEGLYTSCEPKFVLFDSFDDILPDVVNDTNSNSTILKRFYKVVNINPSALFKAKGFSRRKITRKFSTDFSEEFSSYYNQSNLKVECSLDGADLYFYVYEDNNDLPFRPSQRSRGFQWFLSFFLTLKAETTNNCILLIDEPGLYLHAKAQNDVLEVLENLSVSHQIVMTTHSPYLIDPSRLERVRLVLKTKNGNTYIENKIHKGADKDTLTPIITSIGLDLSNDLVFSRDGINVLVEGISDYFYLEALKRQIKIPDMNMNEFRFIPNVGATQIPNLAALLIGWGLKFFVVLDNDKEGERVRKTLLSKLAIDQNKIIFVSNIEGYSIEDMFSKEDFYKFIFLDNGQIDNQKSNSKLANSSGKVLLAKKFNESCYKSDLDLSQKTINNFKELFMKLSILAFNDKETNVF